MIFLMPHTTTYATTAYILRDGPCRYRIRKGFVPNMKVEGTFYVNSHLGEFEVGVEHLRVSRSMYITHVADVLFCNRLCSNRIILLLPLSLVKLSLTIQ